MSLDSGPTMLIKEILSPPRFTRGLRIYSITYLIQSKKIELSLSREACAILTSN